MNIVVTTPMNEFINAAQEAADVIEWGGGFYYRRLGNRPANLNIGDKVFYVERGFIRGFAMVNHFLTVGPKDSFCDTSVLGEDRYIPGIFYVVMDATTWTWIEPIEMKGFQGWQYFSKDFKEVGNWLDPMPGLVSCKWLDGSKYSLCGKGPRRYKGSHPLARSFPQCADCLRTFEMLGLAEAVS